MIGDLCAAAALFFVVRSPPGAGTPSILEQNPARRPLIVFEPKSMLRLKAAASQLNDITSGTFRPLIGDQTVSNAQRLILCSGKIYWELLAERTKRGDSSTAIARVEQLYPLPIDDIAQEMSKNPSADVLWVQDEPANQGPWPFVSSTLLERGITRTVRRVSRKASASPATGSHHVHEEEQKALIAEAFAR